MEDFSNKVVAITGGATGIGFALAKSLGADGAKIIIGEPRQEALDSAIARLTEMGIEAIATPLDVANLASVEAFADVAWKHYGRVDILINNAGVTGARGLVHKVDIAEARKLFDVNFFGVWHGCSVFSARMIEQGTQAAIYNLGSENSLFVAVPKSVAYVASKHAVLGLSESLRNDLPDFIHVGTIFPGYVDTPLTAQAEGGMNADHFAKIVKRQIQNGAHMIVSHSYNIVHIDKRHAELTDAYATYAPRYEGDDKYDVGTLIAGQVRRPKENS
jgi:NAD(P)-dependent dehydrogenase (short-subunit alcohol dehydrogenase family)